MAVLSCMKYKTIPTTCVEYGHPWTDSCRDATLGLLIQAFKYSLRTYATLYLFTALMRRKKPTKKVILQTIAAILQSTVFLTTHAYGFSACLCTLRRLTGRFDMLSVSFTPAFISSLVAIHLERPSRRPILCLYVTNIASETLFRMAVERGWVKPIRYGEIFIFAASMTSLLYRFRGDHNDDSMFSLLRFVLGKDEERLCMAPEPSPTSPSSTTSTSSASSQMPTVRSQHSSSVTFPFLFQALRVYRQIVNTLKAQAKAPCCPHDYSCLFYTLKGGVQMLGCGYGVQVLLRAVLSIGKIYRKPSLFPKLFYTNKVFNLGAFLGLFTSTFRGTSCLLRWLRGRDSREHSVVAGLLAGLAFWFYPDTTIALYVMWKALQVAYMQLHEAGYLPAIPHGVIILYAFSTAVLFHGCFVEPNNLRPSYLKFLDGLSGGRIVAMDRRPIDQFGFNTSENLAKMVSYLHINPSPRYRFKLFGNRYPLELS